VRSHDFERSMVCVTVCVRESSEILESGGVGGHRVEKVCGFVREREE